jgi:DNA-binding transcriptional regulator YdaS (Cro superfamily)
MKTTPIQKAVNKCGGQSALAKALNVSRAHVNRMVKTGHVPSSQCKKIELLTGVTAEMLRPDIFRSLQHGTANQKNQ